MFFRVLRVFVILQSKTGPPWPSLSKENNMERFIALISLLLSLLFATPAAQACQVVTERGQATLTAGQLVYTWKYQVVTGEFGRQDSAAANCDSHTPCFVLTCVNPSGDTEAPISQYVPSGSGMASPLPSPQVTITSVTPNRIPAGNDSEFSIIGTGFSDQLEVYWGTDDRDSKIAVISTTPSKIVLTTRGYRMTAGSSYDVSVRKDGAMVTFYADAISVDAPPDDDDRDTGDSDADTDADADTDTDTDADSDSDTDADSDADSDSDADADTDVSSLPNMSEFLAQTEFPGVPDADLCIIRTEDGKEHKFPVGSDINNYGTKSWTAYFTYLEGYQVVRGDVRFDQDDGHWCPSSQTGLCFRAYCQDPVGTSTKKVVGIHDSTMCTVKPAKGKTMQIAEGGMGFATRHGYQVLTGRVEAVRSVRGYLGYGILSYQLTCTDADGTMTEMATVGRKVKERAIEVPLASTTTTTRLVDTGGSPVLPAPRLTKPVSVTSLAASRVTEPLVFAGTAPTPNGQAICVVRVGSQTRAFVMGDTIYVLSVEAVTSGRVQVSSIEVPVNAISRMPLLAVTCQGSGP